MRPLCLLLLMLAFAGCSYSTSAACYGTVMLYYVYRLEFAVTSKNTRVAAGCKGTEAWGDCNFDEFVKFVQYRNFQEPFTGSTGITTRTPDVDQAVRRLQTSGYRCDADWDKALDRDGTERLREVFEHLKGIIEDLRKKLGPIREPMSAEFKKLHEALGKTLEAQRAETIPRQASTLRQLYAEKNPPFQIYFGTNTFSTSIGNINYEQIDVERTVVGAMNGGHLPEWREFMDSWDKAVDDQRFGVEFSAHQSMLDDWAWLNEKVESPAPDRGQRPALCPRSLES